MERGSEGGDGDGYDSPMGDVSQGEDDMDNAEPSPSGEGSSGESDDRLRVVHEHHHSHYHYIIPGAYDNNVATDHLGGAARPGNGGDSSRSKPDSRPPPPGHAPGSSGPVTPVPANVIYVAGGLHVHHHYHRPGMDVYRDLVPFDVSDFVGRFDNLTNAPRGPDGHGPAPKPRPRPRPGLRRMSAASSARLELLEEHITDTWIGW